MPLITKFDPTEPKRKPSVQPTHIPALYKVFEDADGFGQIFQIDTLGSPNREKPGAQSQTLQLTRSSAEELWKALGRTYQFR